MPITINESQKRALRETSILEIERYIDDAKDIPKSLQNHGVADTLFDLYTTDLEQYCRANSEVRYFPLKRSLELQEKLRNLPQEIFDDIVFWSRKFVFPSKFDAAGDWFENVSLVFQDLLDYLNDCLRRVSQIKTQEEITRMSNLREVLDSYYNNNERLEDIAARIGLQRDPERLRGLLKDEFIIPLFNGEELKFFKNISVRDELINYKRECLFAKSNTPLSDFVKDALRVDVVELKDDLGYILVPSREKKVYETVYIATLAELTEVCVRPIQEEDLLDRINRSNNVVKKILSKGKQYDNEFVRTLIYETSLVDVTADGVIIKPQHIKNYSTGSVLKEKALARVIADAKGPISKSDIITEYCRRYNIVYDSNDEYNIGTTKKYGCVALGRTDWIYNEPKFKPQEWVENYARQNELFDFDTISKAMTQEGYTVPVRAPRTLRTYITSCCRVNTENRNQFCYEDCYQKYPTYSWSTPFRVGIVNWLATNIKSLFDREQRDAISIKEVNNWLFERGKGTVYEEENAYGYSTLISFSALTSEGGPFIVEAAERGDWRLKKNPAVYEVIDWGNFGSRRDVLYERKILALATNLVRKSEHWKIPLWDLAMQIYENGDVEGLSFRQIRSKLQTAISSSDNPHTLVLVRQQGGRKRWSVAIDARKHQVQTRSRTDSVDWASLRETVYKELSAVCSEWIKQSKSLCISNYDDAFLAFERLMKTSENKHLRIYFPQRLHEFFIEENLTNDEVYCIMCWVARIFEAILKDIYKRNTKAVTIPQTNGLLNVAERYEFYDFYHILHWDTPISGLQVGSYEKALKYLSYVRNSDAHGEWYIDSYRGDRRSETEKNVEKTKYFVALYIFAVAKYLKNQAC